MSMAKESRMPRRRRIAVLGTSSSVVPIVARATTPSTNTEDTSGFSVSRRAGMAVSCAPETLLD